MSFLLSIHRYRSSLFEGTNKMEVMELCLQRHHLDSTYGSYVRGAQVTAIVMHTLYKYYTSRAYNPTPPYPLHPPTTAISKLNPSRYTTQ